MIKVNEVAIGKRKEYPYDLDHLIKINRIVFKGDREFRAKGFQNEGKNKVLASIVRAAEHLGSNLAIIEQEHSNKRGLYKAKVSFYEDTVDLNRPKNSEYFDVNSTK